MTITLATLVVHDYDEAIRFYVDKVGFTLASDEPQSPTKRWVVVTPPDGGTGLLLARADGPAQRAAVGNQTGGRVAFFLSTTDFTGTHARMVAAGVRFREAPRQEAYGWVCVWEDLYGTSWDLLELAES